RFGQYIGGRFVEPLRGERFPSVDPATNQPLAEVAQGSAQDVDAAVRAARLAQPQWWTLGGHGRARHLYALARQVQKHSRLFAVLSGDAGLPPGVLNIVTGDGTTGEALVQHPGVDKIAFTGSTEVGRLIRVATAGSGKRLSLELGGKSPFLVFEDADLDSVVEGVVDAIWFNQGQVCCAGSRIIAQEGAAVRLVETLRAPMATLRVGPPLDKAI